MVQLPSNIFRVVDHITLKRNVMVVDATVKAEDKQWINVDENLLKHLQTKWLFGDWDELSDISQQSLLHHPDRAQIALLVASGHAQLGRFEKVGEFVRLAQNWGCPQKLISQILVSGVQNSLSRAALIAGNSEKAHSLFIESLKTGMPEVDVKIIEGARKRIQTRSLRKNQ